jgi:hypothetical protein
MVWYFAYGSNMSAVRLIDERLSRRGVLVSARVCGRPTTAACSNVSPAD